MCWEPMEVALCLNIDCSSPWKVSISPLNLILSYSFRKRSQFVLPRCGNYYSFIYWTCFRNTHQKNVMSLLFKFCFQNIFSELKQIKLIIKAYQNPECSAVDLHGWWSLLMEPRHKKPQYSKQVMLLHVHNAIAFKSIRKKCQRLLCS